MSYGSVLDYPDISFIDGYTITQLESDMLEWYGEKCRELTGAAPTLLPADERRLILSTCAYYLYQCYKYVDTAGKMGLLKYSAGDFLENLGALLKVSRNPASGAITTLRFSMVSPRTSATGVPAGTRVTAGDNIFFATSEYAEIPAGELSVDVQATCLTTGEAGNAYAVGDINTMVDVVPYIDTVENIDTPSGGADIESDDSLRNRIYLAPSSYSTAGPVGAYDYYVRAYSSSIADVRISSPSPVEVVVRFLLSDGSIPGESLLNDMEEYLRDKNIRPLTDHVTVAAPTTKSYDIDVTYYIAASNRGRASTIQAAVADAITSYRDWQGGGIGRDINPDVLRQLVMEAGAKRVIVTSPVFTTVSDAEVAVLNSESISYGGIEDD